MKPNEPGVEAPDKPFGTPTKKTAPRPVRIVLYRPGLSWRFVEAPDDWACDGIVDESWIEEYYQTTEAQQCVMLNVLARKAGLIGDAE